jgi:hypothetical protein
MLNKSFLLAIFVFCLESPLSSFAVSFVAVVVAVVVAAVAFNLYAVFISFYQTD